MLLLTALTPSYAFTAGRAVAPPPRNCATRALPRYAAARSRAQAADADGDTSAGSTARTSTTTVREYELSLPSSRTSCSACSRAARPRHRLGGGRRGPARDRRRPRAAQPAAGLVEFGALPGPLAARVHVVEGVPGQPRAHRLRQGVRDDVDARDADAREQVAADRRVRGGAAVRRGVAVALRPRAARGAHRRHVRHASSSSRARGARRTTARWR